VSFVEKYLGGRLAQAAFWGATMFTLVMALIPKPPAVPVGYGDKVEHAVAFATLGVLGVFGYPRLSALRLIVALSIFGAFIELAQATPIIHRDCDPLDWVADTVACIVVVLAMQRLRRASR
jgi:hypothetical protein